MNNVENIIPNPKIKMLTNSIKQEIELRNTVSFYLKGLIKKISENKLNDIFTYNKIKSIVNNLNNNILDVDDISNGNFYYRYCNISLNNNYIEDINYLIDTYKMDGMDLFFINLMFHYNDFSQLNNHIVGEEMFSIKDVILNIKKNKNIQSLCVFDKNNKIVINHLL